MPIAKKIILAFISLVLILVLVGLVMPSTIEIKRSIEIQNDQLSIYNQLK